LPGGCPQQLLQWLQQESELAGSAAADVVLWRIAGALHSQRAAGLSGLKRLLPDDSYGQIKVGCTCMLCHQQGRELVDVRGMVAEH
jgi:hypothetical protein